MSMERLTWTRDLDGITDIGLHESVTVDEAICRLADIERILGNEYDLDHIRELVQAEKDGQLRVFPKSEEKTCGSCGHFRRTPGKRAGVCEVWPFYKDRRGCTDTRRGTFAPSQSRKCCRKYIPRKEAEAALKGETNETNPV